MKHIILGKKGEIEAVNHLKNKGYKILQTNYVNVLGEIDIIAKQDKEIVFVEVKTRLNNNFGTPAEAINNLKKMHILKSAQYFLYKNKLFDRDVRFDAIEVLLQNGKFIVNHIEGIM